MLNFKPYIFVEFIVLCIVLPTYIWTTGSGNMMFLFLWAVSLYALFIWPRFKQSTTTTDSRIKKIFRQLKVEWNWQAVNWKNLKPVLLRWVIASILIYLFTWQYEPDKLFFIPIHMPQLIPVLLFVYTLISALPQEFIFCSFFMRRYGQFFDKATIKILLSALVFAYAHMLFLNWIAPVFSFIGGVIFAYTYLRTQSLALVTIEHGLYGNSIFIAGIGYYFYTGNSEVLNVSH